MRVIVTRPQREALRWVAQLRERGLDAVALPLIEIAPAVDTEAVRQAWDELPSRKAVMFVSANAVEGFFAQQASHAFKARAWATGPGTQQALLDAGVDESLVDCPPSDAPQYDSEALWQLVGPRVKAGDQVLIVRGSDAQGLPAGRDWFADQLRGAGAMPHFVLAYRRKQPQWDESQRALAMSAAGVGDVWLFSSSESIAHLCALLPAQAWAQAHAVATHARIAQAARDAGFGVVCESRPGLAQVVASIESLQ